MVNIFSFIKFPLNLSEKNDFLVEGPSATKSYICAIDWERKVLFSTEIREQSFNLLLMIQIDLVMRNSSLSSLYDGCVVTEIR